MSDTSRDFRQQGKLLSRKFMRKITALFALLISSFSAGSADMSNGADNFYTSDRVSVQKVRFSTQYGLR
jgi:hypothetical protein